MTMTARIVKAVVTLPILGTVSRNEHGDVVKSCERYRVHVYAAKPGWKYERPAPDFLVVGVMTGGGFTSEPTKQSQHVLMPEGHELVALMIDSDGCPKSFESLPLETIALPDGNDLFKINNGQVFIDSAFIQSGNKGTYKINVGVKSAPNDDKFREIVGKYLTGEATEYADQLVDELKGLFVLNAELDDVSKAIKKFVDQHYRALKDRDLRPGGELWTLLRGR